MQSTIDSHILSGCSSVPLHSTCFENAISGSGQIFPSMKDFRDVYLLSIAGRFWYKLKRNSPQHTSMACTVDGCLWKVTTNAIPATQMVQVFSFKNMHSHLFDNSTFHKPIIRTKNGCALVDDLIKGTPYYLPKQICRVTPQFPGVPLTTVNLRKTCVSHIM